MMRDNDSVAKCTNCALAILYPDGRLRCSLDGRSALSVCLRHIFGKVTIYRKTITDKPTIVKRKGAIPSRAVRKPKPVQRRMFDV